MLDTLKKIVLLLIIFKVSVKKILKGLKKIKGLKMGTKEYKMEIKKDFCKIG